MMTRSSGIEATWPLPVRTRTIAGLCAAVAILGSAPRAEAEGNGFAEVVVGMANPLGDDDYDNVVDTSFKLGVRGGVFRGEPLSGGVHLGIELGADWALANNEIDNQPGVDATFHRLRFLGGGRVNIAIKRKLSVFFRAGVGVDFVIGEIDGTVLGIPFNLEENDLGLAFELGTGAVVEADGYLFGMHLALPIAWHSDDNNDEIDYDYTSYELDLLLTAGTRF